MMMFSNVDASGYLMFHTNVLRPALFETRGGGGWRRGPSSCGGVSSLRASERVVESAFTPAFLRLSARAVLMLSAFTESRATMGSCALVKVLMSFPFESRKSIVTG